MLKKIGTLHVSDIELMLEHCVFQKHGSVGSRKLAIRNWILADFGHNERILRRGQKPALFLERSSMPELPEVETVRRGLEKLI